MRIHMDIEILEDDGAQSLPSNGELRVTSVTTWPYRLSILLCTSALRATTPPRELSITHIFHGTSSLAKERKQNNFPIC